MRLSELGTIYRHEKAGTLHGLLRIRGGTQDDSHIVCTPDQLVDEILAVFELTLEIHRTFGFTDPVVELSTLPGQTIVDEAMAARATEALTLALEKSGLEYRIAEGEGAFYGPKVDFHFRDAIGRLWQLTTVQCDFALPERFDMEYTGDDNQRHRPVMIHRAILGTLERFSAVLIEHYGGAFPLWLSPEQLRLVPVADRHVPNCEELAATARAAGLRVHVDETKETVGKKIRAAQLMKAPYVVVVGDRDLEAGTFTVRDRSGEEHAGVPFDRIVSTLDGGGALARARAKHLLDGAPVESLAHGVHPGEQGRCPRMPGCVLCRIRDGEESERVLARSDLGIRRPQQVPVQPRSRDGRTEPTHRRPRGVRRCGEPRPPTPAPARRSRRSAKRWIRTASTSD